MKNINFYQSRSGGGARTYIVDLDIGVSSATIFKCYNAQGQSVDVQGQEITEADRKWLDGAWAKHLKNLEQDKWWDIHVFYGEAKWINSRHGRPTKSEAIKVRLSQWRDRLTDTIAELNMNMGEVATIQSNIKAIKELKL